MTETNTDSGSDETFTNEEMRFVELMIGAIGTEGVQNVVSQTLATQKRSELLQSEIINYFKCEQCGRCCTECDVQLSDDDIIRICKHLEMGFDEFYDDFMNHEYIYNYLIRPCPFLKDGKCDIYVARPHVCRQYPFADNTVAVHPCKIGGEIHKTFEKVVGKAPPDDCEKRTMEMMARTRKSAIDIMRNIDDAPGDDDKYNYMFVEEMNLVAILKYLRKQDHHMKELLACKRGII